MKLVAISGATGFVGGSVAAALCLDGTVKLRILSRTQRENRTSTQMVVGDITDIKVCEKLVEGADAVVHAAGLVRTKDDEALLRVNVEGTRVLVQAARRAGVPRFVHMSSTGVYGSPGIVVDEMSSQSPENPYERSKSLAEALIEAEWGPKGSVVIRPSNIIGTSHQLRPLLRFLTGIKTGRPVINAGAWTNYVGVNDVARVVVAAAMIERVPSSLIVNVPLSLNELVALAGNAVGRPGRAVGLPGSVGRLLAPVVKPLSIRVPTLGRVMALLNQTRYCSLHDDWFEKHGLKPRIEPVLCEIAQDYGLASLP